MLDLLESLRPVVFLLGCIGTRLWLAQLARTLPAESRGVTWLALAAAAAAAGMVAVHVLGLRPTALEAGGRAWWDRLRPVHASLLLAYALMAGVQRTPWAYLALLADAFLGLGAWIAHRVV